MTEHKCKLLAAIYLSQVLNAFNRVNTICLLLMHVIIKVQLLYLCPPCQFHLNGSYQSSIPLSVTDGQSRVVQGTLVHNVSVSNCQSETRQVVFFIRIPKCASTSFVDVLRSLAIPGTFELYFHPSGAFNWNRERMERTARLVHSKLSPKRGFVYAQHFYHVDFHQFGLLNYTYITIMREPLSRFVSSYLYYHLSSKTHIQSILDPMHKDETLEECLAHEHEGCTNNLMTKYFCGHDMFCKLGNKEALQKAKSNLQTEFMVVGILEDMRTSVELLKRLLPMYFGSITKEDFPDKNVNEHSLNISLEARKAILKANSADVELYNFAYDLLRQKANMCGFSLR